MIFLDSNIIIDLIEATSRWSAWARHSVARVAATMPCVTNAVVMAETASHFDDVATQLDYFADVRLGLRDIGPAAAYRAGRAHRAYRRAGGDRSAILPDFLIGGHAVDLGATLVTRDRQRFASYFPDLTLITPETHP
ncbi:MAG TPA: type II toxin-antitoxin system VapC family toxin [Sphingomonas sp.]|nr:type II toxin-antitoxin system VapC family toxin [Sphingomonas sp.]